MEIAASSASIDLNLKFPVYRRNQVREYIVWRTLDRQVDWFVLRNGDYDGLRSDDAGILRSEVFPGLWLDPAALFADDVDGLIATLDRGHVTPDHAAFVAGLAARRRA